MRKIRFEEKGLPLIWWVVLLIGLLMLYDILEDYLSDTFNVRIIYYRRISVPIYVLILVQFCFPETLEDLVLLVLDVILWTWKWFEPVYKALKAFAVKFVNKIAFSEKNQLEPVPGYLSTWKFKGLNINLVWGRVRIAIVISPEALLRMARALRRFVYWLGLFKIDELALPQKQGYFEMVFLPYLYTVLIPAYWKYSKLFQKYLWPENFGIVIYRIVSFAFLNKIFWVLLREVRIALNIRPDIFVLIWRKLRQFLWRR